MPSVERLPQRGLVVFFAQRRGEDVLGLFPALAGHLLFEREHQVLRASLRQGMQAAVLRVLKLAQGVLVGKMHDVHRGAGHMRDSDGAVCGLSFCMGRPAVRVMVGLGFALREHARNHDVDHAAILSMDAAESVQQACLVHDFVHQPVVDHEDAGIGHEELERRDALLHHGFHLGQALRAVARSQVGDGHVQPVVDAGLAVALGQPGLQSLTHGVAPGLQGEVDDGGGSAHGRGDGAGAVIVGGYGAAEGHIEMGVHVDPAGHNEETRGVNDRVPGSGNIGGDLADRLSVTEDVGLVLSVGVDDGAILDQGGHVFLCFCLHNFSGAFRPGLRGEPVVDALHGDAAVDRADQRAEIATDTVMFVHPGNTLQRGDCIGMARAAGIQLGNGCGGDAASGLSRDHGRCARGIGQRAPCDRDECIDGRHPSRRCSKAGSRCIDPRECGPRSGNSG